MPAFYCSLGVTDYGVAATPFTIPASSETRVINRISSPSRKRGPRANGEVLEPLDFPLSRE
jgi:hypothetical protein